MQNRKVFRLLEALPKSERETFRRYLQSPLHNPSAVSLALFEAIQHDLEQPAEEVRSPQQIHASLPTESRFSPNYFDKLCAALLKSLNDFLVWREFEQEPLAHGPMLLRAYNRHNLAEHIPALHKSVGQELEEQKELDELGLEARYQLEREYGMYIFRQPRAPAGEQLLKISQQLQNSFLARGLEIAIAIHNYNQVFQENIPVPDLAWAKSQMEADPEAWPVILRVNFLGYKILSERDGAAFHAMLDLLDTHAAQLGEGFRREMYTVALNFCAFRINQGDGAYLKEADRLYLRLLDAGWLLRGGKLPSELFKNIISLRLRMGESAWVARFIEAYADRLTNPHEGLALKYNRAVLRFYEGDYDASIRLFDEVIRDVKSDMYYGADARVFMLKALYDRNRPDDTYLQESQWNAFRVFITRNKKLGQTDQNQYLSFAKLYRRLVTMRGAAPEGVSKQLQKLGAEVAKLPLSDRHWFEAKLGAL